MNTHAKIILILAVGLVLAASAAAPPALAGAAGQCERLVFLAGTPHELEVYRIKGRLNGPTAMILGGIHGDEPGAYLSADLYADLTLKRGQLIVIPRANFKSIIHNHRGTDGDMNRKFALLEADDPEAQVVAILKSLMAESDLLLTMHDGSGFYRPTWESDLANPNRYGQSIIADAGQYLHPKTGHNIDLQDYANKVIARINKDIDDPLHKFHFFNMETDSDASAYKEHRNSATYYALTKIGIPAFCIETSKQLPSMGMKIHQHNLAINAFLDLFGLELEQPGLFASPPGLSHLVISVNNSLLLAAAPGHTLLLAPGDTIEVVHIASNVERGLTVQMEKQGSLNDLNKPFRLDQPTSLVVRKDKDILGRVNIEPLPGAANQTAPRLLGEAKLAPLAPATLASLDTLPGAKLLVEAGIEPASTAASPSVSGQTNITVASAEGPAEQPVRPAISQPVPPAQPAADKPAAPPTLTAEAQNIPAPPAPAGAHVTGFKLEVDDQPVTLKTDQQLTVMSGARVKLVDFEFEGGQLPAGLVMNLKGFVAPGNELVNTGEDRGATANTATDMMPHHSEGRQGEVYAINAELGKKTLATAKIRIVKLKLASVTVKIDGQTKVLPLASRTPIVPGAKVELLAVTMEGGLVLDQPRYTLAGHPLPNTLPQTLIMRDIAINLAVFNADTLAGKVTWLVKR